MATIHIAGRPVGTGQPCLIIAEAGVNHNGDVEMAHRMIDAAVEAGADCVKFQAFPRAWERRFCAFPIRTSRRNYRASATVERTS